MKSPPTEKLRQQLVDRGYSTIEIGNLKLDLKNKQITRTILLNGTVRAQAVFPSTEIDWGIITGVLRDRKII